MNRARTFWLAVIAGAVLPLALAPFDYWPLSLVSVAVLFRVLDDARPARAAYLGWGFGVGKYGVGASWIYVSIHDYGPAPVWLAGSLVAVFVVAMASFPRRSRMHTRAGCAGATVGSTQSASAHVGSRSSGR